MKTGKIILFTIVAIIGVITAMLGVDLIIGAVAATFARLTGIGDLDGWATVSLIVMLMWFFPRKWLAWNRKYECHGTTMIQADIAQVWRKIELTARDEYFTPSINQVRAVPGTRDEFQLMFDGPPADGIMPAFLHVRVTEDRRYEYLAYRTLNAHELPLFGKDHLMTEFLLSQQEDGVRVTMIETLSRITLGSFLAFLFLNPAKDGLKSLKAQLEGTQDVSMMTRMANDMGPHGEPSQEIRRAIWVSSVTAVVFTATLTVGVMVLIAWLVAP